MRNSETVDEVRKVSSQNARDEAKARHQQVVKSMAQSSIEHAQNLSNQVATQVRHETLGQAEPRHHEILRETIHQAETVHSQTIDEVRNQSHTQNAPVILDLQSQIAHLSRLSQDLLARLEAAECSGSVRALAAEAGQRGLRERSNAEMFDLFAPSDPVPQPSSTNDPAINQVLAVLHKEVQHLRDEVSKKKRRKGRNDETSSDSSEGSSSSEFEPEFVSERKLMRLKAYEKIKVPSLPKSAAHLRTWKNSLISHLAFCCRSSERVASMA